MSFSTRSFYELSGNTTAIIPPPGNVSDGDYSDSEELDEYVSVSKDNTEEHSDTDSSDAEYVASGDDSSDSEPQPCSSKQPAPSNKSGKKGMKKTTNEYKWESVHLPPPNRNRPEIEYTSPAGVAYPIVYFRRLFTDDVIDMIVQQTNLYSVQTTGKSVKTDCEEIKTFLSMLILMGLINLPAYRDYWNQNCRIETGCQSSALKNFATSFTFVTIRIPTQLIVLQR